MHCILRARIIYYNNLYKQYQQPIIMSRDQEYKDFLKWKTMKSRQVEKKLIIYNNTNITNHITIIQT